MYSITNHSIHFIVTLKNGLEIFVGLSAKSLIWCIENKKMYSQKVLLDTKFLTESFGFVIEIEVTYLILNIIHITLNKITIYKHLPLLFFGFYLYSDI